MRMMWECARPFRTTKNRGGFPRGSVVKNPPANAGDTGSTPGPVRSYLLQSHFVHAPQLKNSPTIQEKQEMQD